MPNTHPPDALWFANQLAAIKRDIAQLKTQTTQYVVDPSGVCQAIIGNLSHDHEGNSTGLGNVWGLASFKTGTWTQL